MSKEHFKTLWSGVLFVTIFLYDMLALFSKGHIHQSPIIRESIIIIAFLLLYPRFLRSKWLRPANVSHTIRNLFLAIIGIYVLFFALTSFSAPYQTPGTHSDDTLFSTLPMLLVATLASLMTAMLGIAVLLLLRELIYFHRRRTTARNFRVLAIIALIQLVYLDILHFLHFQTIRDFRDGGPVSKFLLLLFIMAAVLNSFRTAWVNYLNRKQKLAWFAWGLVMLPACYAFLGLKQHATILEYSLTLSLFIRQIAIFLAIYWSMAMISVLLHLPTAGLYDRKRNEILSLHRLSRTLTQEFNPGRLLVLITQQSSDVIDANGVWLEMYDSKTNQFRLASAHYLSSVETELLREHAGNELAQMVLYTARPVLIADTLQDDRADFLHHLPRSFRSVAAVPLSTKSNIIGVLFAVKLNEYSFDDEQLNMLQAFADQASIAMENARLINESIQKERLQHELQIAHDAQMKLLPKQMPTIPHLDVDAVCVTANEVGGDYFDFFQLNAHELAIVVGDVSGKGPEAAFYMAEVKGIVESLCRTYRSPRELLIHTNDILYTNLDPNMFVTLLYAVIDTQKGQLTFGRAGHCPLLHIDGHSKTAMFYEPAGLGLGIDRGRIFERVIHEQTLTLADNDICVFYTDGLIEAQNSHKEEYGDQRLLDCVTRLSGHNARTIREELVKDVQRFISPAPPFDDLTVVVMRLRA